MRTLRTARGGGRSREPVATSIGMGWAPDRAGGLNRYYSDLHAEFDRLGIDVRGLVFGPVTGDRPRLTVMANEDAPLSSRLASLVRALLRSRPRDVLVIHFALYGVPAVLLNIVWRRRIVVHFHGPWAAEDVSNSARSSVRSAALKAVERFVYRSADAVIVLSPGFRELLVEQYGVDPRRVEVVRPGVDTRRFAPLPEDPAHPANDDALSSLRSRWQVPSDARVVVCARRLVPRMGVDILLSAWEQARLDNAVLVVVGDGQERASLGAAARAAGLTDVVFTGEVSDADLVGWYRCADLTVVPSVELEGFGLVVLESLACGTPVIGTDVGGLRDQLLPFDESLVVPPSKPRELATRIRSALDGDRPSRARCREYALRYSWQAAASRVAEVYGTSPPTTSRAPRVMFLSHVAELSGAELAMLRLLPELRFLSPCVVLGTDGPLRVALEEAGIEVEVREMAARTRRARRRSLRVHLVTGSLDALAYALALARDIRRRDVDAVHAASVKSAVYGGVAAALTGRPFVWHVHDRIAEDYLGRLPAVALRRFARWIPDAVIVNSTASYAALFPRRAPRRSTLILHNPVAEPFHQIQDTHDHRLPADGVHLGMVGRLSPWKGQHVLLEALAQIRPEPDLRITLLGSPMFGEEDYEMTLRRRAEELGLAPQITWLPFTTDAAARFSEFDVLVHCSVIPEPFGQVVAEGLAAGLAVVATRGGPDDLIADGSNGLLVTPGDRDELADAIRRLAGDGDLRLRLGRAGRASVAHLTTSAVGREVDDFYRTLLTIDTLEERACTTN